jgi:hypothetical protein
MLFTSTGASDVSLSFRPQSLSSVDFWGFDGLRFNLSTGTGSTVGTNVLTVTRESGNSTGLNTIVHSQTMTNTVTDHEYYPNRQRKIRGTDSIRVAWTNDAASAKSWGCEIDYEIL